MRHNQNHKLSKTECETCKAEESYDKTKKFTKKILSK